MGKHEQAIQYTTSGYTSGNYSGLSHTEHLLIQSSYRNFLWRINC